MALRLLHPRRLTRVAAPPALPWPEWLQALESWLRGVEDDVRRGAERPPDAFAPVPDGPLPPVHAVRARTLLDALQRAEALVAARRRELDRALVYAAG